MAARLGNVLYILGCFTLAAFAVGATLAGISDGRDGVHKGLIVFGVLLVPGVIAFGLGWVCRYVLRGP